MQEVNRTVPAPWTPIQAQKEGEEIVLNAYARDGRLLLVVSNLGMETADAVIRLSGSYTTARNAISGEAYALEARAFRISCASMGWALVELA
ncbi:MAG: hypothetical protein ACYDCO_13640 [Armatimonadota bacterium]